MTPSYYPGAFPAFPDGVNSFLQGELRKISTAINDLARRAPDLCQQAPTDPQVGMVVYALAPWNPGAGNGEYAYTPGGWVKLI